MDNKDEYFNEIIEILDFEIKIQENILKDAVKFPDRYPNSISSSIHRVNKMKYLIKKTIEFKKELLNG